MHSQETQIGALRLEHSSEEVHWDWIHLDFVIIVGRKRVLSQDLAAASNCKKPFFHLLSQFGLSEPMCHHYLLG